MNIDALFSIKDKVTLVTGGSRGIGEMIATGFVQAGAKVYITSRKSKDCEATAAKLNALGPGQAIPLPADLQSLDQIKELAAELSKRETHLDVLVNNAGMFGIHDSENTGATWGAPIDEYPEAAFQKVMNLNVTRIFSLTQALLPLLRANATQENPSRVINIGSVAGEFVPHFEAYAYSASKAAVAHMTRHLAGRLGRDFILCNTIQPGSFPSKMIAETFRKNKEAYLKKNPLGRIGTPEDVAGTCIYLASRASAYTNGATITIDGGVSHNNSRL